MLTDEDGGVTERTTWGPWGERFEGGERSRVGYTGHQTERESGLHYSAHRYLDPRNGRWARRDPLGDVDGQNRYLYSKNNPMMWIDTLGLAVTAVFDRTKGILHVQDDDDETKVITILGVFSGMEEHENNPDSEWIRIDGPIPVGKYLIGLSYEYDDSEDGDWNWYKLYGRNGSGGYSYTSVPVTDPSGRTITRGGFNLHVGLTSFGCVTIPSEVPNDDVNYPTSSRYTRLREILDGTTPLLYNRRPATGWLTVK